MQTSYLVTAEQAAKEVFGVCLRQFQLMRKKPGFPTPRALGPRALRWVRVELEQYACALPPAPVDEPQQLKAARKARAAGHQVVAAPFNGALA